MQIYASYHNTGDSHQAEYALTAQGWFWRWHFAPTEWKPLKKMQGTLDATGQMWCTYSGIGTDDKEFSITLRLTPVTKERRWGHAPYPPEKTKQSAPSVPSAADNKEVPPAGAVPGSDKTLSMSDLLVLDSPKTGE